MSEEGTPPVAEIQLSPQTCPAFILAGGRSSRFGSDKALVEVDGQPLILALRDALLQHGHRVSIVADHADRYRSLGLDCWVDHASNSGPLAGVATALQQRLALGPGWGLILSCDQLVWRGEWFEQLAAAASDRLPCELVHFVSRESAGTSRCEPLPCLLHTRLLSKVLLRLQRHQLSLHGLFSDSAAAQVTSDVAPKQWSFNSPQELSKLNALIAARTE